MRDSGCEMQNARLERGYRAVDISKLARQSAIVVHCMTLQDLPKFEMYEEASHIRRSAKSIAVNIVEGFGRRRYKQEFIRFLVFVHAFCDETIEHLEMPFETGSLTNEIVYRDLSAQLDLLGRNIIVIESIEHSHRTLRSEIPNLGSRTPHLAL